LPSSTGFEADHESAEASADADEAHDLVGDPGRVRTGGLIDETVFHQLLHWHHFYDKSTMAVGLVSDGIFHAFGFTAMVVGLFLMADSLRQAGSRPSTGTCPQTEQRILLMRFYGTMTQAQVAERLDARLRRQARALAFLRGRLLAG
jgi:hypothetical protein